jgi:hypothetical protein
MSNFVLSNDNFLIFATKQYINPICLDIKEFQTDLRRILYIQRLFTKFELTGEIKERLVINHLILFYNVFDVDGATKLLFFKIDQKHWGILKAFLIYLNYMPDLIFNIKEEPIKSIDIPINLNITQLLQNI